MLQILGLLTVIISCVSGQYCSERTTKGFVGGNLKPMLPALSDKIIHYINEVANTTWKAGPQKKFSNIHDAKRLLGVLKDPNGFRLPRLCKMLTEEQKQNLPDQFDSRTHWKNCRSISIIRDQSDCGSCWAFGAVEAMSDRHCIALKGKDVELGAVDLLSCCGSFCGQGCEGGFPAAAWDFWVQQGIVTGGAWNSSEGCKPYPFEPCEHHTKGPRKTCSKDLYPTPECKQECRVNYTKSYMDDKYYGMRAYTLSSKEEEIKHEIMTNGPVEADFTVYADFINYKSGVYEHVSGSPLGGHAIRVLGWGVENGTPYWLCANSWNSDWGDNGYFKIRRGRDECGIEEDMNAGIPKV